MTAFDDLTAAVAELTSDVAAESTELEQVVSGLQSAEQQITALQAKMAGGSSVTEAELESLASSITMVAQGAKQATTAAEAAIPPPPPSAPSPTSPTAAAIAVTVSPASIPADGTSQASVSATVTDSTGAAMPSETITFTSSDPAQTIAAASSSATITASSTPGTVTITATDGTVTGTATLTQF